MRHDPARRQFGAQVSERPHGRDTSGDARAIPQRRRTSSATPREPGAADRTRAMPVRPHDLYAGWHDDDADLPSASWPTMPTPVQQPPAPAAPSAPPARPSRPERLVAPPRPRRPRHTVRRVLALLLVAAIAWFGATIWAVHGAWSSVGRVDAAPVGGSIGDTDGSNYLMVGSDARAKLTPKQRKELGTGYAEGARTDSIMVLHTGGGDPTLLSIPRDSYVEIPGHGMNKINAAFAIGGPPLLAATVEKSTGLHLDGYVEIGFAGFADLVDAVGGVRMCLPHAMNDDKAHIDLPAGCQTLNGKNALGYVRARYSDPEGDLGRVKRQRQFLGALMGKIATPATVIFPWRLHSVGTSAGSAVAIGTDDGLIGTSRAFLGLRAVAGGRGNSVTVPVANAGLPTAAGLAVQWDAAGAERLFTALRHDDPLPSDLLPAKTS